MWREAIARCWASGAVAPAKPSPEWFCGGVSRSAGKLFENQLAAIPAGQAGGPQIDEMEQNEEPIGEKPALV